MTNKTQNYGRKAIFWFIIAIIFFILAAFAEAEAITVSVEVVGETSVSASVPCNPVNCATSTPEVVETTSWLSKAVTWLRELF